MQLGECVCFGLVLWTVQAWTPTSRLSRDVTPKSYTLTLVPNIDNDTFTGDVTILMRIEHSMRNISLNSHKLKIAEITLDQAFGRTGFQLDLDNELLHVFYLDQEYIDPGEHMLNIKFNGSLNGTTGFYSFKDGNKRSTILATKFSSIFARSAFPCFDEPYFKSVFSIRLVKPNNSWTALSNMKEIGSFNSAQGIAVDFQSTVPMSTYLLAWILTDYTYDELIYVRKNDSIPLRFFTLEGRENDRKDALVITKQALQFFENYTGIPYQLSKLDSIEVPSYRSSGMEHWGLIVYKTNTITHDKSSSTFDSHLSRWMDALTLISHEVSHMWFGNLVTHEWYNDLWLTEGFARFIQFKAMYSILEEPFVKVLFQNYKLLSLFQMQCSSGSITEIASYPRRLKDIMFKYGPNTYDQGAAVLMMLEDLISAEKFQEAVKKYLKAHEYKSVTTSDIINTVQNVIPSVNLRNFMETYMFQKRLPLVIVSEDVDQYILKQEPFCKRRDNSIFGNKWTIPIRYITSSSKDSRIIWLDKDMANVTIPKSSNDQWIKINHLNIGLYRSLYTETIYQGLKRDFQKLDSVDKGALFEETFLLAGHERLPCEIPLQLLGEMRTSNELDYLVFTYASRSFSIFFRISYFEEDVVDILKSYVLHIFEVLYHKIPWTVKEDETINSRLLRMGVLESLCLYNHKYDGCYKDVENIKSKNLTIHDDIAYIYKSIELQMEKMKLLSAENRSNISVELPTSPIRAMTEYEEKCARWIKGNIPKLIEDTNKIK